jgi:hypothetical protein
MDQHVLRTRGKMPGARRVQKTPTRWAMSSGCLNTALATGPPTSSRACSSGSSGSTPSLHLVNTGQHWSTLVNTAPQHATAAGRPWGSSCSTCGHAVGGVAHVPWLASTQQGCPQGRPPLACNTQRLLGTYLAPARNLISAAQSGASE